LNYIHKYLTFINLFAKLKDAKLNTQRYKDMIIRLLSKFTLKFFGWKMETEIPDIKKCIMIGAPHTSNYDFYVSMLFFLSIGMKISFLIKKEVFVFPIAGLIKKLGGIPVDRKKKNSLIEQLTELFESREKLFLLITPEGTRSRNENWKKGFYYIAKATNVPIALSYMDYKYKTLGIGPVFNASDDVEADLIKVKKYYQNINAKYPEKFATGLK